MADYKLLIPFILSAEGGLSRSPNDMAGKNPQNICPYAFNGEHGFHTNKGITWGVFKSFWGDNPDTGVRFFVMAPADWVPIFKKLYWDAAKADYIASQRVA